MKVTKEDIKKITGHSVEELKLKISELYKNKKVIFEFKRKNEDSEYFTLEDLKEKYNQLDLDVNSPDSNIFDFDIFDFAK